MLRESGRARAARRLRFSDIDEGLARNQVEPPTAGMARMLTVIAMMPLCGCFARRVNSIS
ncbi:hypothetical protein [Bradyrhizobium cajani]|uniref:Uncharacterized protein n=1 Tax=Bradyrhizobium cajani TaxID=1928661 RepID=A0A844T4U2_9BRAD|nr:hypothetical protein [Bradyrhizobium cajani]MCP3369988.1 hypothetical protein [Bradyrhizobium cajani]MVT73947.1 hypothetical protein [Bradyrhizobium cajani]